MKEVVRAFLLRLDDVDKTCEARDGVLYSYDTCLARFKSKNIIVVDTTVRDFSKTSKRLFTQLQRDMVHTGFKLQFTNTSENITKRPYRKHKQETIVEEEIKSIDSLLSKLHCLTNEGGL